MLEGFVLSNHLVGHCTVEAPAYRAVCEDKFETDPPHSTKPMLNSICAVSEASLRYSYLYLLGVVNIQWQDHLSTKGAQ